MTSSRETLRRLMFGAASVLALAIAPPASAQQYDDGPAYSGPTEEVIVQAPRHHPQRSVIGAPIEDVAISREVRFDDLDLRTSSGAHRLRERVRETARALCQRLDVAYPIATEDSPPCYQSALRDAMYQADGAIHAARSEASAD